VVTKELFFNISRTTTLVVESNSNGPTTAWRLPCFACTFWCGWSQQLALWGWRLSIWGHFGSFTTEVSVKETREREATRFCFWNVLVLTKMPKRTIRYHLTFRFWYTYVWSTVFLSFHITKPGIQSLTSPSGAKM
jgi:hypothetical protein